MVRSAVEKEKERTHLYAALGHDRPASDVVVPLVNHHQAAQYQLALHVGHLLRGPSEVERRLGVGRLPDGQERPKHGQQKKKPLMDRHDYSNQLFIFLLSIAALQSPLLAAVSPNSVA